MLVGSLGVYMHKPAQHSPTHSALFVISALAYSLSSQHSPTRGSSVAKRNTHIQA